jgi:hypothetical protein
MERQTLRITIALGMLITLVGGTGIFAVFSDRATTGTNSISSGSRPSAADLKIEANDIACAANPAAFVFTQDDTTTAQFNAPALQPGSALTDRFLCLGNVGSASLDVTATAIDIADVDTACTGSEAAGGDQSCGSGSGELGALLRIAIDQIDCADVPTPTLGNPDVILTEFTNEPVATIPAGGVICVRISGAYPVPASEAEAQIAQSDTVTWRFAFDGTAP